MGSTVGAGARVPEISQADFECFHADHFSTISTNHFTEHFLGPIEEDYTEQTDDDDLGYYEDGTKRTLTDEQIAIFRHSEIHSLLRVRQNAQYTGDRASNSVVSKAKAVAVEAEIEDGELEEDNTTAKTSTPRQADTEPPLNKKQRKALNAKNKGFFKQNIKPDLRKRTWDKVEQGVGSLAYDEDEGRATTASGPASQRRRISYDD